MTAKRLPRHVRLPVALVIAAIVISAGFLAASYPERAAFVTLTSTSVITVTQTTTITSTATVNPTSQTSSGSGSVETVPITITDSTFQPPRVILTIGHNNTVTFFDRATQPGLVKLSSESPWPSGFTAVERGLNYGENTTVTLNIPGVYYFVDDESANQGNVTIDVVG